MVIQLRNPSIESTEDTATNKPLDGRVMFHSPGYKEWWTQYPILKIADAAANERVLHIDCKKHITLRSWFIDDAAGYYEDGMPLEDILAEARLDEVITTDELLAMIQDWMSDGCLDDNRNDSKKPTTCQIYIGALKELLAVQQRLQQDCIDYLMGKRISTSDSYNEAMEHVNSILEIVDKTVRMECERLSMAEKLSGDEHHEQL